MTPTAKRYRNDFDAEEAETDEPVTPAAADPDEPRDESAAESFGRSISEVVTGPLEDGRVDRRLPESGSKPRR